MWSHGEDTRNSVRIAISLPQAKQQRFAVFPDGARSAQLTRNRSSLALGMSSLVVRRSSLPRRWDRTNTITLRQGSKTTRYFEGIKRTVSSEILFSRTPTPYVRRHRAPLPPDLWRLIISSWQLRRVASVRGDSDVARSFSALKRTRQSARPCVDGALLRRFG